MKTKRHTSKQRRVKKILTPKEAIIILKEILGETGYEFHFDFVDIWIEDKTVKITGKTSLPKKVIKKR